MARNLKKKRVLVVIKEVNIELVSKSYNEESLLDNFFALSASY
jgi:hypothetical protein